MIFDASRICPVTDEMVVKVYEHVFAPWVYGLGLCEFSVSACPAPS